MAPRHERMKQREASSLEEAAGEHGMGVMMQLREWIDALIIAFVLAMFIRTFVVELFKIPSGSMSPTLLGDLVAEGTAFDKDGQSRQYLMIIDRGGSGQVQVFRKDKNNNYSYEGKQYRLQLTTSQRLMIERNQVLEEHRIFVNKFAYWFDKPDRGDIVVFRVPFTTDATYYERNGMRFSVHAYNRNQSVYVKRAVAFAGEQVDIRSDGRLLIDGKMITDPKVFDILRYTLVRPEFYIGEATYSVKVPDGSMLVFGDNTDSSYDSRYWGPVPYENLRGKAFLRYWPWRKIKFLT